MKYVDGVLEFGHVDDPVFVSRVNPDLLHPVSETDYWLPIRRFETRLGLIELIPDLPASRRWKRFDIV
jgi:hypothetical protein